MRGIHLALALTLGIAARAVAADLARDPAGLQGNWRAIAAERNGAPAPEIIGNELTFEGDRFRITRDGAVLFGGRFTTAPGDMVQRIDLAQTEGATLRGTWRGIWRLEGERLEIVDNAPDMSAPVPSGFAAGPGSGHVRILFEAE